MVKVCWCWLVTISILFKISTETLVFARANDDYDNKPPETLREFPVKSYSYKNQFSFRLLNYSKLERDPINNGLREEYDPPKDNEQLENRSFLPQYSLLIQVLIFICCAAGVSAVIILCCLICLHSVQFFTRSTVIVDEDGMVHMMSSSTYNGRLNLNSVQIQRFSNNETVLTFVPPRRHPWSPATESEHFNFHLEGQNNDLPPTYDELTFKDEEAGSSSPPPPPYTPSFHLAGNA